MDPKASVDVLLVHASSVPNGGVVNATLFYALALREAGFRPEIWTASDGLCKKASALRLSAYRNPALDGAVSAALDPRVATRASAQRRGLKAVVHQGDKAWTCGRIWLAGVPEYVVFHNRRMALRHRFRNWLAISSRHAEDLRSICSERKIRREIGIIRNGPLPTASVPRPSNGPVRTIGAISTFAKNKGMELLVEAFANIEASDLRLILAGDGPQRQACQALAARLGVADRIAWPGWLDDTSGFFQGIDALCSPSLTEPFGIVMVEAMQAGLPVVATATDGARDIVVGGVTGWLVPVGDAQALGDSLQRLVQNPENARAFGEAGRRRFGELYTPRAASTAIAQTLNLPLPT
jgi:glycosyltransferase involved in cell wall biosynthesis